MTCKWIGCTFQATGECDPPVCWIHHVSVCLLETPVKPCIICGTLMYRRRIKSNRLEAMDRFTNRRLCSNECRAIRKRQFVNRKLTLPWGPIRDFIVKDYAHAAPGRREEALAELLGVPKGRLKTIFQSEYGQLAVIEDTCDKLRLHPTYFYGDDYYKAAL